MIDRNLKRDAKPVAQIKLAKNCDLIRNIEKKLWADNKVQSSYQKARYVPVKQERPTAATVTKHYRSLRATASGAIATPASVKLMARVDKTGHDPTAAMKKRLISANKLKGVDPTPVDWRRQQDQPI